MKPFLYHLAVVKSWDARSLVQALLCRRGKWGPGRVGDLPVVTSHLGAWDSSPTCWKIDAWAHTTWLLAWVSHCTEM